MVDALLNSFWFGTDGVFFVQLDYKVDDSKLREVFRLAGKVICAEVTKDKDFKSRGFGVVEMDHPVEAVQVLGKLFRALSLLRGLQCSIRFLFNNFVCIFSPSLFVISRKDHFAIRCFAILAFPLYSWD